MYNMCISFVNQFSSVLVASPRDQPCLQLHEIFQTCEGLQTLFWLSSDDSSRAPSQVRSETQQTVQDMKKAAPIRVIVRSGDLE
ncbi:hypothetical protein BD779DRAFT_599210 [Infundibulicybe gibba]|nr:hypothetical protein BD779DRAFT_599210 [Infundibulicybe gibba]